MAPDYYRTKTSKAQRTLDLRLTIDPGFVHKRRIQTVLGQGGMDIIDEQIERLPALADWTREVRIDHIYTQVMLEFCRIHEVKTLDQVLFDQRGHLFCSTLEVAPCPNLYDIERATSFWVPSFPFGDQVEFEYATDRIRADTLKERLRNGTTLSMIALFAHKNERKTVFDPLIMGFPWLVSDDPKWADKVNWWRPQFYENYLEDFDEFSRVTDEELPEDFSVMKSVPEEGFKRALAKILVDETSKDWGGETSDHFTTHIHINGRRVNAAGCVP